MTTEAYILVVDDDPDNLFLMAEVLRLEGYEVQTAKSGFEALEKLEGVLPQLILLDVMMPEMNGFEVCRRIRSNLRTATIPILFLTALDNEESHLKGIEVMGDDYLTKPIQTELLVKRIHSIIKLSKLRNAAHQQRLAEQVGMMQLLKKKHQKQMAAAWKISESLAEKFHLFVPQQFLERIAPQGLESIRVGYGVESDMTILFCDIRNFTSIVESQKGHKIFEWLNAFFESINQAVVRNHGFVDKYLGDAVMAVFDRENHHAVDALNAAIKICEALEEFNEDRHRYGLTDLIRVGIGVQSGMGLMGTIGANQRMDSTVVGDVVNTASRLEEMTKTYQCPVICSETVVERLSASHDFQFRWLDRVSPRGKQVKLDIYEFLGLKNQPLASAWRQTG